MVTPMVLAQRPWLIAGLCFVLMLALRLPFLSQTLLGEEGTHAMLVIGGYELHFDPSSQRNAQGQDEHCLLIVAQLAGVDVVARPGRSLMPYCILGYGVRPLVQVFHPQNLSFDEKSVLVRSAFLAISIFGMIALTFLAYLVSLRLSTGLARWAPYLILLFATSSPLIVGATIQPQLDGAFGFAFLGTASLLLYGASRPNISKVMRILFAFGCGILATLCKNEWPIALMASILGLLFLRLGVLAVLHGWAKFRINSSPTMSLEEGSQVSALVLGLFGGMAAGIALCYWLSPSDYMAGFSLMHGIQDSRKSHWKIFAKSVWFNAPLLKTLFILLAMGLVMALSNWRRLLSTQFSLAILWVWACAITIGFLQSGWGGDGFPRYFVTSFVLAASFVLSQLPAFFGMWESRLRVPLFLGAIFILTILNITQLVFIFALKQSITVPADPQNTKEALIGASQLYLRDQYGVVFHHSSLRYYFPGTNFISQAIGEEGAKQWKLPDERYHMVF
jgi:hypothetical protein